MERGAPKTPLCFGRGAVEKWPTTPSFFGLCPHPAAVMALAAQPTARSQEPTIPRRVCRASPGRFAHLARQQVSFDRPRSAAPLGEGSPARAGWKLPLADCLQRKILPGPGSRASALLPCRFFHPAGQRAGFGHPRGIIPSWKGAPAKSGRKLPPADCPQRKVLSGPDNRSPVLLPCQFFYPAGQRAGFGHPRGITLVQADDSQARADPAPPADHLPQRTLPDPGNRSPAPLPVYPPCWAANRSRLA